MKKLIVLSLVTLALSGCSLANLPNNDGFEALTPEENEVQVPEENNELGSGDVCTVEGDCEIDADLAYNLTLTSECADAGEITKENYFFNSGSDTYWFDMTVEDKPGCSPACVVSGSTGAIEINWRCTGLIVE